MPGDAACHIGAKFVVIALPERFRLDQPHSGEEFDVGPIPFEIAFELTESQVVRLESVHTDSCQSP